MHIVISFLKLAILLTFVYAWLPTMIARMFRLGVREVGGAGSPVALTFDDGPDPEYTPRLLDLLKSRGVPATFFVLGSQAAEHPGLICRMKEEGHLIGIHNFVHRSNAILTPWGVRRQLREASGIVERITGERPRHYRPPWGVFNLFDFFWTRSDYNMVLWSVMVGDWSKRGGADKVRTRLLSGIRGGAVIVLHDSGRTFGADRDAPGFMLEALEKFLDAALEEGYTFVRMDEYQGGPGYGQPLSSHAGPPDRKVRNC